MDEQLEEIHKQVAQLQSEIDRHDRTILAQENLLTVIHKIRRDKVDKLIALFHRYKELTGKERYPSESEYNG